MRVLTKSAENPNHCIQPLCYTKTARSAFQMILTEINFSEGKKESIDEIIAILAFAYRKHFSHDEIKEWYSYYSSSAANKLTKKQEFSSEEKEISLDFATSAFAQKVNIKQKDFDMDAEKIAREWKRELFMEGMGALAKSGYTK